MDSTSTVSRNTKPLFANAIDFCQECGSILPLPVKSEIISCVRCGFKVDIRQFDGLEMTTTIVFNKADKKTKGQEAADRPQGPLVDRTCLQCGHETMTFTTRQTRSADEGQTVFYTCTECLFQETEYS